MKEIETDKNWRDLFFEWLKEICPNKDVDKYCQMHESVKGISVFVHTRTNRYYIVAYNSYIGCQVQTRKPRAGEDWTRGNDLADGKFNRKTWEKIKNDIIKYEFVVIAKKKRESYEKKV